MSSSIMNLSNTGIPFMTEPAKKPINNNPDEVQKKLDHVIALMEHEGFEMTDEDIDAARAVITGEVDVDVVNARIVAEYKKKNNVK